MNDVIVRDVGYDFTINLRFVSTLSSGEVESDVALATNSTCCIVAEYSSSFFLSLRQKRFL